jgi:multidrug transporter EmrE-like cation transporter
VSSATISPPALVISKRRRSFWLVFCCTLVGAMAQMFIKTGATHLTRPGFVGAVLGMLTNPMLFTGYALYGFNTVLLAVALRESELSLLYPVIALTFVWVSILSVAFLHESMNPWKGAGIVAIVLGVAVLGRGSRG